MTYVRAICLDCPEETGTDLEHGRLVDKWAENHVSDKHHATTSGTVWKDSDEVRTGRSYRATLANAGHGQCR